MNAVIDILAKQHNTWISYVISMGCNKETANDIVQEMYFKINDYLNNTSQSIFYKDTNEINYFFVYVTLRNMLHDLRRKEKNVYFVEVKNINEIDEEYQEVDNDQYNKLRVIEEYVINQNYLDLCEDEIFYDAKKFGDYYKRKIFEEVYIKGKSISKFSRDSGISYYSVYNTIKNIKKEIRKIYGTRRHNRSDN